ncbi:hypothetical protein KQX54_007212, partial [Cotesia glomerata]
MIQHTKDFSAYGIGKSSSGSPYLAHYYFPKRSAGWNIRKRSHQLYRAVVQANYNSQPYWHCLKIPWATLQKEITGRGRPSRSCWTSLSPRTISSFPVSRSLYPVSA